MVRTTHKQLRRTQEIRSVQTPCRQTQLQTLDVAQRPRLLQRSRNPFNMGNVMHPVTEWEWLGWHHTNTLACRKHIYDIYFYWSKDGYVVQTLSTLKLPSTWTMSQK